MQYVIGVDLGTSGTKTVLFDRNGQTVRLNITLVERTEENLSWINR